MHLIFFKPPNHRIFNCSTSNHRSGQVLPFISFDLRVPAYLWGCYDQKTDNMSFFFLITVSFLHIESCIMHVLKALIKSFISSPYNDKFWSIYEDIMTQTMTIWWFEQCFVQSDSPFLFYVTSLWNHAQGNCYWQDNFNPSRKFYALYCGTTCNTQRELP